jgi:hypothetical protein
MYPIIGYRTPNDSGATICLSCFDKRFGMPQRSARIYGSNIISCNTCWNDASFPLVRNYKLGELDEDSFLDITGTLQSVLRDQFLDFFVDPAMFGSSPQFALATHFSPWHHLMEMSSLNIWVWRRKNNLIEAFQPEIARIFMEQNKE